MSRYSPAYQEFRSRLAEVELLYKHARTLNSRPDVRLSLSLLSATSRSCVVMLSSHVEGYFRLLNETAIETISRDRPPKSSLSSVFKLHFSSDLIDRIKSAQDPVKIAQAVEILVQRDGDLWGGSTHFPLTLSSSSYNTSIGNPTFDNVCAALKRFGYDSYKADLVLKLKGDFGLVTNSMNQMVATRNRIAHGDQVQTGSPQDLYQMIQVATRFCRETDCLVANWFKGIGCSLRRK